MARLTQLKKVIRSRMDQELDEAINRSLQDVLEMDIDFFPPDEPGDEEPTNTQDDADEEQDHADEERNDESTQSDD
eukprot:gene6211-6926_t